MRPVRTGACCIRHHNVCYKAQTQQERTADRWTHLYYLTPLYLSSKSNLQVPGTRITSLASPKPDPFSFTLQIYSWFSSYIY